jgi:hypothetical protein
VVCVLQSLLTNCTELLSGMRKNQKPFFKDLLSDAPHEWGLRRSFVEQDTFPIDLPLERVLEHLRNALSHPTAPGSGSYLSTGYTTNAAFRNQNSESSCGIFSWSLPCDNAVIAFVFVTFLVRPMMFVLETGPDGPAAVSVAPRQPPEQGG